MVVHILEIYISNVKNKWYRNSSKEFNFLRDTTKSSSLERTAKPSSLECIDPKLYSINYYDVNVNPVLEICIKF